MALEPAGWGMAKGSNGSYSLKCPACAALVRRDRLLSHLKSVHPMYKPDHKLMEKLKAGAPRDRGGARARSKGIRALVLTRWRVVGIVALVLAAGLIAYAFTRPSPTQATTGKSAPDFTFADMSGASHSLSSYQGHPVLLWWIATWCPHCTQDTQVFSQSYYSQYHAAGVTILEIQLYNNLGESGPSLTTWASDNGYTGQVGWTIGSSSAATTNTYDPQAVTDVYYLLNSQGVILTQGTGAGGAFGSLLQQAQGQ